MKVADAAHYADQTAENISALVVANAAGYSHIVAPATTGGKNYLPRVAALLDVAQISDIVGVESADTFVRPIYAGNVLATVQSADAVKVITVRTTAFEAAGGAAAAVEAIGASADAGNSKLVGRELTKSAARNSLPPRSSSPAAAASATARTTHQAARAARRQARCRARRLACRCRRGLRAERLPGRPDRQDRRAAALRRGRHPGAIQHLAGMKDSKVIVAINKDPEAPIFQVADYGLVADLFEVVPQLTAAVWAGSALPTAPGPG